MKSIPAPRWSAGPPVRVAQLSPGDHFLDQRDDLFVYVGPSDFNAATHKCIRDNGNHTWFASTSMVVRIVKPAEQVPLLCAEDMKVRRL